MHDDIEDDAIFQEEDMAWENLYKAIDLIVSGLEYTWPTGGDEDGSGVLLALKLNVEAAGYTWPSRNDGTNPAQEKTGYQKRAIPTSLRVSVFERDLYRCKTCGTHKNLTCDHIYPERLGGPTEFSNLQTLCRTCNSRKGAKAPEAVK